MDGASPKVSICIPTYNGRSYVHEAIESALGQSESQLEVVVSDDGSADDTLDVVRTFDDPRLRILPLGDRVGAAANWNRAIEAARGRFVKLMCQDDVLYRDAVRDELAAFGDARDRGLSPAFVSSRRQIMRDDGRVVVRARGHGRLPPVVHHDAAVRAIVRSGTNVFGEPSFALFPRTTVERVGRFDGSWSYLIDLDFYIRALEVGPAVLIDAIGGAFRVSVGSWSSALAASQFTETRAFMQRLRESGQAVTTTDRMLGLAAMTATVVGRRVMYAYLAATS